MKDFAAILYTTMKIQNKLGDCYLKSLEFAKDATTLMHNGYIPQAEVFIVHGWITPQNGPCAGREIKHSWVELGSDVVEASNNNQLRVAKVAYYEQFKAIERKRYTLDEATVEAKKKGHAGPWDCQDQRHP